MSERDTPEMMCSYILDITLYLITINNQLTMEEWLHLNFSQLVNSRQVLLEKAKHINLDVGMNAVCNRFHYMNGQIPLEWFINIIIKV
jgi:hypothetical protein